MKLVLLVSLAGCASSSSSSNESEASASLSDLRYAPPTGGWKHTDMKELNRSIARWQPEENANKETISIIRTEIRAGVKGASSAQLEEMLRQAQGSLPSPALSQPTMSTTKQHLQEVEIVADFVPKGLHASYHRVHALIVDGNALVNVLYTARTPDPDLTMFRRVVESIHRAEG